MDTYQIMKDAIEKIEKRDKVWEICEKFMKDQEIRCVEDVHQTDRVIENAYEFIEEVCNIIGYPDEDD